MVIEVTPEARARALWARHGRDPSVWEIDWEFEGSLSVAERILRLDRMDPDAIDALAEEVLEALDDVVVEHWAEWQARWAPSPEQAETRRSVVERARTLLDRENAR